MFIFIYPQLFVKIYHPFLYWNGKKVTNIYYIHLQLEISANPLKHIAHFNLYPILVEVTKTVTADCFTFQVLLFTKKVGPKSWFRDYFELKRIKYDYAIITFFGIYMHIIT